MQTIVASSFSTNHYLTTFPPAMQSSDFVSSDVIRVGAAQGGN